MDLSLLLISIAVGCFIAFLVTGVMKGQLKSVQQQPGAINYAVQDSLNLTVSQDVYLYTNTTKTARNSKK